MKRRIIGIMILVLSLSLVGCSYKVKDDNVYKQGGKYFELKENKDLALSEKLNRGIEILSGDYEVEEFSKEDKQNQYKDYKYGILQTMISEVNKAKENGITKELIKNESTMIELDELAKKQKELYGEDYDKIVQEFSTLLTEINENYKGDNIDKSYVDKSNSLNKEYMIIKDKITEQTVDVLMNSLQDILPKTYKATGTIKIK